MKCKFCGRHFPSDQSLYAHFKHCQAYREHKLKKQTASLGQAVPKAGGRASTFSHPGSLNSPDPISSLQPFFEAMGVPSPPRAQETPQERRRTLLQAAKSHVVDRHPCLNGSVVTVQMRARAKLAIDDELRDEPLEEFSTQEVMELAEDIRDRVYATFLREHEKAARRTCEAEARKQRDEAEEHRKAQVREKKAAYLEEAGLLASPRWRSCWLKLPRYCYGSCRFCRRARLTDRETPISQVAPSLPSHMNYQDVGASNGALHRSSTGNSQCTLQRLVIRSLIFKHVQKATRD